LKNDLRENGEMPDSHFAKRPNWASRRPSGCGPRPAVPAHPPPDHLHEPTFTADYQSARRQRFS